MIEPQLSVWMPLNIMIAQFQQQTSTNTKYLYHYNRSDGVIIRIKVQTSRLQTLPKVPQDKIETRFIPSTNQVDTSLNNTHRWIKFNKNLT